MWTWTREAIFSLFIALGASFPLSNAYADADDSFLSIENQTIEQEVLRGDDCKKTPNQLGGPFENDTECYVTKFPGPGGDYQTHLQTNSDGSYDASVGFTFDLN